MAGIFAFQDFELDVPRFELRRAGRRVNVQPKVLRLLFHLVAARHRSVSSEELLDALWPNEKVSPASVKRAIRGARAALGDRGESQNSIRTVRGHGYQFVLPVEERQPPSIPPALSPAQGAAAPTPSLPPSDAFVGRESVLALLDAAMDATSLGRAQCVLISGEPGIGKTRVLHELAARAAARGAQVWSGRCREVEGAPAFWPLIQVLRAGADSCGAAELHALMGAGAVDIAEAIPELRQCLPELPAAPAIASVSARFRFFDSMALFLERAAARNPLVLLFDDLQRADQPTLRLLLFIVRQIDTARVLLAGTIRPSAYRDAEVANLLGELAKESKTRSIELEGLGQDELARYVESRTGSTPPASVVAAVHEQTAGNPLFVEQLLHRARLIGAASAGRQPWDRLAAGSHANGLSGAIARHLESVDEPCRALLNVAAVLGREFSAAVLAEVAATEVADVLEQLSSAAARGIVRAATGVLGNYRFTHALIRDALYEGLPLPERARLHGCAGLALEGRGAGASETSLPELTQHFVLAAPLHDGGRALQYAWRAARSAMQRLAYEEAEKQLERALQVLTLSSHDPRQRIDLLLERGQALQYASAVAQARAVLLEVVALAREHGATDALVRAAVLLAHTPEWGAVDSAVVDVLEFALGELPEHDPRTPRLQALLAKSLSYSGNTALSSQMGRSALALARRLEDPARRAEALHGCLEALAPPHCSAERRSIVDELMRIGHEFGDHGTLLRASAAQVWLCVESGDMAGADQAIAQLDAIVERVREPLFRWYVIVFRGMRAFVQGRLVLAEQLAHQALQLGSSVGEALAYSAYCVQMNGIYQLGGRMKEAEALVRDISARCPALGGWQAQLAGLDTAPGHAERARAKLEELMADGLRPLLRSEPFVVSALAPAAELCARFGNAEMAELLYETTLPFENQHGNVSYGMLTYGPLHRHLGLLAMRMGDLPRAESHLQRAIAASEAMPSPPYLALCCLAYARVLLRTGDNSRHSDAAQLLCRAHAVAHESALHGVAGGCRGVAQAAGIELPPPR